MRRIHPRFSRVLPPAVAIVTAVFLATVSVSDAHAQKKSGETMFGLGLQLGEPMGGTGKVIFSETFSFQFGAAFLYWFDDYFYTWADAIWYPAEITTNRHFSLSWYFGVGGAFGLLTDWDRHHPYWDDHEHPDGTVPGLWLRAPFGFSFFFNEFPLEAYIDFGPQMQVYPPIMVYPFVGVGARWYFI